MDKKPVATTFSEERVVPLAFALAVSPEVEAGAFVGLISQPTGSGYPPEDDPG